MANPFGDFDDEEVSTSSARPGSQVTPPKSNSGNPFGDFDEKDEPARQPARPAFGHLSSAKKTTPNSSMSNLSQSARLSSSRQSLSSNSETMSIGSSNAIGNYSLGDGSLQKEGLLCPNCMVEFKTITELMRHSEKCFASSNADSTAALGTSPGSSLDLSGQMGVQIKDFFLNKIRKGPKQQGPNGRSMEAMDGGDRRFAGEEGEPAEQGDPVQEWKSQMTIGPRRNHMEEFRKIRETRIERYVYETNKLLIRLDKLLRDYPPLNDPVRRREHEQSVVNWIDETMVHLCPSCASKFNIITRKKHHCRLCGAVMCAKCSEFIDFDFARRLITPVGLDGGLSSAHHHPRSSSVSSIHSTVGASPGNIGRALLSVVSNTDPNEMADKIRVCLDCKSLLENRKEKLEIAYSKPPIVQMYAELRQELNEIERLLPILLKMSVSLNSGETTYSLMDANDLKRKLTRLGEKSDLLSRKIEVFGIVKPPPTAENPTPTPQLPPQRQLNLQLSIRRSTIAFLRKALLGLPELPDEKKFAELKARNDELIQKRIAYEKEMVLKEQQMLRVQRNERAALGANSFLDKPASSTPLSTSPSSASPRPQGVISLDDGFCPQTSSTDLWRNMNEEERAQILDSNSDPLAQQISIIRTYIRAARDDHRYEEVAMLEENLKELEIEYYFKQQQLHNPRADQSSSGPKGPQQNAPVSSSNPFGDFDDDEAS